MNRMDAPVMSQDGSQPQPRTVALMNQKGGVGKTTTTVNLGAALAMKGRRCLLVDLDPQAHCTLHLGIEPPEDAPTAYDLLMDGSCSVYEALHRGREGLDLVPAETSLAAAEVELTTQPGREMILREKVAPVLHQYDYVLYDCPPSLGLLTLNALVASNEVVIPMQAHFLPLQGVGKLLETVALVRQRLNPQLRVAGIVLCSHDGQTTLAREIVADLREFFGSTQQNQAWNDCEIFEPPIRRNIKLAEAPSFGQTIFEYASWAPGAQDYNALAANMLWFWEGEAAARTSPRRTEPADADPFAREGDSPSQLPAAPDPESPHTSEQAPPDGQQTPLIEIPFRWEQSRVRGLNPGQEPMNAPDRDTARDTDEVSSDAAAAGRLLETKPLPKHPTPPPEHSIGPRESAHAQPQERDDDDRMGEGSAQRHRPSMFRLSGPGPSTTTLL